jgi:hypothetical protein
VLSVSAPNFPSREKVIYVPDDSGRMMTLTASLGSVRVTSPSGASVASDGKLMGKAPITLQLPAGQHHIKITSDTLSCESPVTVVEGGIDFVACRPDQTAAPNKPGGVAAGIPSESEPK